MKITGELRTNFDFSNSNLHQIGLESDFLYAQPAVEVCAVLGFLLILCVTQLFLSIKIDFCDVWIISGN
jgi:hypothetical protein